MPRGVYPHTKVRRLRVRRRAFQRQHPAGLPVSVRDLFGVVLSEEELEDREKRVRLQEKALRGDRQAIQKLKEMPHPLTLWIHGGRRIL